MSPVSTDQSCGTHLSHDWRKYAANVSIVLSRLGHKPALITLLGQDVFCGDGFIFLSRERC